MNMLKRTLAMVLVLCMLFSVMPVAALADDSVQEPAGASVEISADETDEAALAEDEPDADAPEGEEPKVEEPKVEEPKVEEPKVEEPKVEEPKVEEPKVEEPKVEEPKVEEPEVEEPADDETADSSDAAEGTDDAETEESDEELEIIDLEFDSEAVVLSDAVAATFDEFVRAFALDCGRLYFSVEDIKEIIDVMASNDYTHLTLAFGNSGFRFLLDDMTIGTYSSDAVKAAIQYGNTQFTTYDGHNGNATAPNTCLTQADMDEIISYANSKDIEIIPALNSPGHMNTIVYAMDQLGIENAGYPVNDSYNSESTLNIDNATVMAFTDALIQKYINYFDGKGCTMFNLGADEFANDPTDDVKLGFNDNMKAGFITYVNKVASMISNAGMIPMMFNDGYAWTDAEFNKDIVVCYWTSGAVSSTAIANAGHNVINNSQNYYYVLGEPFGAAANNWCSYASATNGVNNVPVTQMVDGGSVGNKLVGSQMWLWCDFTDETYTETEEQRVHTLIAALAENNPDKFTIPEEPAAPETRDISLKLGVPANDIIEGRAYTDVQIANPSVVSAELTATPATAASVSSTAATQLEDGATYILRISGSSLALSQTMSTGSRNGLVLATNNLVANSDYFWQLESSGTGYKLKCEKGYLNLGNGSASIDSTGEVFSFNQTGSGWQIVDADNHAFNNLGEENVMGGWTVNQNPLTMELYKVTAATAASTKVTFTGKEVGETTVTVGHVTYNVSVSDEMEFRNITLSVNQTSAEYIHAVEDIVTKEPEASIAEMHVEVDNVVTPNVGDAVTSITDGDYVIYTYLGAYLTNELSGTALALNQTEQTVWHVAANSDGTYYITDRNGQYLNVGNGSAGMTSTPTAVNLQYGNGGDGPAQDGFLIQVGDYKLNNSGGTASAVGKGGTGSWARWQFKPYTESSESSKKVTFTGVAVGNTTATVGNVTYNITVTEEDLSTVSLTYHPWLSTYPVYPEGTGAANCTNNQGVAIDLVISAEADGVYSEQGAKMTDLVAPTGDWRWEEGAQTVYWKATILAEGEHQEGVASTDKCMEGTDFSYIRYLNGTWSYSADRVTWTEVKSTDEVCVYYLQETDVTDEVETFVKDWAFTADTASSGQSTSYQKALSFAVVYPGGTMNPSEESIYQKSTLIYYDNLADLGFIRIGVDDVYQVEKITYTFGARANPGTYTWSANETINWQKKTIGETEWYDETVCWDQSYGTEPVIDGEKLLDVIYPGNPQIQGNANQATTDFDGSWGRDDAVLILIYLQPVITEDSLTVIYYDEKFGDTLFTYPITVASGTNFNNGIGKYVSGNGGYTIDTNQTPGAFLDEDGNPTSRIDVTGYGITNIVPLAEKFETDLTKVPDAFGKYNSELYKYTGSEIKDDGKTLYLYYNIDTEILSPNFIVDFGLPLTFGLDYLLGEGTLDTDVLSVDKLTARYGTVEYDETNKVFIYTPNKVLKNIDVLAITMTMKGLTEGSRVTSTTNVGVTPATTVYYEENFLTYDANWSAPTAAIKTQATEVLGDDSAQAGRTRYNYGYDPAYVRDASGSNGTNVFTTTNGATASFTFTGTGFALYANCNEGTGYVTLTREGETKKMYMMDTGLNYADLKVDMPGATATPSGYFYNIPVIAEKNLPYGEYTVTIRKTHNDGQKLEIDGFRVYEPIDESQKTNEESFYRADKEDKPVFYELRDLVLKAIGNIDATGSQVYNDLGELTAIITDAGVPYAESSNVDALLNHGPKNEIYLYNGQTLTFRVKTDRVMQIGLKAPNGATTYDLTCDNGGESKTGVGMYTSVDMFYHVGNPIGTEKEFTVQVTNRGDKVLAVTELKVCDDPNFAFLPLTEADISGILKEETEPEAPTFTLVELKGTDVTIDGTEFQYTGKAIEPAVTVTVDGNQLVEGKDYSVTYTNNVEPGTATVTVRGIATASETLGYTGEVSINYTITAPVTPEEPEIPEETTKPTEPEAPTEPEKPGQSKATAELKIELVDYTGKKIATAKLTEKGTSGDTCYFKAQEILKAAKSKLSGKYAIVDESAISGVETVYGESSTITVQVGKVATLKITFINLRGKKVGTATLTKVQTDNSRCTFQASEIRQACPAGRRVLSANNVRGTYGKTASTMVIVF